MLLRAVRARERPQRKRQSFDSRERHPLCTIGRLPWFATEVGGGSSCNAAMVRVLFAWADLFDQMLPTGCEASCAAIRKGVCLRRRRLPELAA